MSNRAASFRDGVVNVGRVHVVPQIEESQCGIATCTQGAARQLALTTSGSIGRIPSKALGGNVDALGVMYSWLEATWLRKATRSGWPPMCCLGTTTGGAAGIHRGRCRGGALPPG